LSEEGKPNYQILPNYQMAEEEILPAKFPSPNFVIWFHLEIWSCLYQNSLRKIAVAEPWFL
jgi:hypothetical protein